MGYLRRKLNLEGCAEFEERCMTDLPSIPGWVVLDKGLSGGQGHTFRVRRKGDPEGAIAVAKLLRRDTIKAFERFEREVRALQAVRHPHVLQLMEDGLAHEVPYIITAFAQHGSLQERRLEVWAWPTERKLDVFSEVCDGVAAAHANDVIHRDVKPGNIFLSSPTGGAVVGDFGLAYFKDLARVTSTDEKVGPVNFIAPELANGRGEVRPTCDVYSLGKVLHWLFARQVFAGEEHRRPERNIVIINQDPLLGELNNVIGRAIAYEPRDRYPTVEALKEDVVRAATFIKQGVPAMDVAYEATYEAAQAVLDLAEWFDERWSPTASTTTMKSVLDGLLRRYNEHRDVIHAVVEDEFRKKMDAAIRGISTRSGFLNRQDTGNLGDYYVRRGLDELLDFFSLREDDEAYVNAIRSYQSGGEQEVYLSSKLARLIPEELERLRERLTQ